MRKKTANTRPRCPKTSRNRKPEVEDDDDETKHARGFYACYLLTSLSPRFKGHTYIGFTVNPRRRIRQHNGELRSGALRTKKRRPWEMVFCIYGFPTNVSALQFEWAWQHPMESVAVRQAAASFKSFSGVANKIKLAYTMLSLPPWQSLNITVNYFSTKYSNHSAACPNLPEHMKIQVCPVDELPCYTEADESPLECHDASCGFDGKESCENTARIGRASNKYAAEHQSHSLARGTGSASDVQSCNDSKDDEECNVDLTYWNLLEFHNADYGFDDKENFENATSVCIAEKKGTIERRCHSLDEFPFCNSSSESASDVQSCNDSKHVGEYNVDLTLEEYNNISADPLLVPEVEHEQRFSIVSPPNSTPYCSTNGDVLEFADIAVTESSLENGKILTAKDDKEKAMPQQIEVIDLLSPSPGCRIMSSRKKRRVLTVFPHIIDLT